MANNRASKPLLHLAAVLLVTAPAGVTPAAASGFALDDDGGASAVGSARPVRLASAGHQDARLLPLAMATAAAEVRRDAARASGELAPGADGKVDLALTTLIDHTLRSNLDIRVQSYQPALSIETVAQREAIFDPLLRFTFSLFTTTSPTVASLEGADVLAVDRQSWDVELLRNLEYGGSASIAWRNRREETNSAFSTVNPSFNSTLDLSITQPLLRNFGSDTTRREIKIANNDRHSSVELFRAQVITSITAAVDSYWDLFGKIQNLEVREEALTLSQDLLRINKTRVEVGTMAPLEIATAEAEVARNEELLITAKADVENAADRIYQLIGAPLDSPLWKSGITLVDGPVESERRFDIRDSIETALSNLPSIRRQRLALENDEVRLAFARNQLKPALNLNFGYGLAGVGGPQVLRDQTGDVIQEIPGGYGDSLDGLTSFDFDNWRVSATYEMPVFNESAEASHATALLNKQRDEASLEQLRKNAAVTVRRLVRAVDTSWERITAAKSTRALQEKRLDAEQKKFEHGLSTNFEVSQAQQDLTEARTSEIVALTNYNRALASLDSAKGTVLESYGVEIDQPTEH